MVDHCAQTTCLLQGSKLTFYWKHFDKESASLDTAISLEFAKAFGKSKLNSVPFYMSIIDVRRFAEYLAARLAIDGPEEPCPFVPMNLGFEWSMLDCDGEEVTVVVLLNLGFVEGNRVYGGSRCQALVSEIQRLARSILEVVWEYGEASSD